MTTPVSETNPAEPITPVRRREAKRKEPSRLSSWRPDVRWAHPFEAAAWVYAVGWLGYLTHIPGLVLLAAAVLAGVALAFRARAVEAQEPSIHAHSLRQQLSLISITGGAGAGLWLLHTSQVGPFASIGWLVVGAGVLGLVYGVHRTQTTKAAEVSREETRKEEQARTSSVWDQLLDRAGLGLRVVKVEETRAGYAVAVAPQDPGKPVTLDALRFKIGDLTALASSMLAAEGVAVRDGDIRVEGTEAAHAHLIHVCTKHVLSEKVPFVPLGQPTTVVDPIDPALYEDGAPLEIAFGSPASTNGQIVGMTGSGKSVFTNALIGKLGECVDCMIGVIASDKLVPLVYPWLRPWFAGETDRPAIDFVAGQDPQHVMEMLAEVYRIMRARNAKLSTKSSHTPISTAPAIVLFIEEAGDMAARKATVVVEGRRVGFSELVHMICKADRSAQISVILLDQNALHGSLGDYGSEISRNTPFRVCLKTLSYHDGPKVLPALSGTTTDTTKLRDFSMLVQPSIEEARVMPAKSLHLEESRVYPVARQNAGWRPELETAIAAVLGVAWSQRWNVARLPELAAAVADDGLTWPTAEADMSSDWDEELKVLMEQEQAKSSEPEPPRGEGGLPDVEAEVAALSAAASRVGEGVQLPEPLHAVVEMLQTPGAPTDFVGTRQLAIMLGRVPADADDASLKAAAEKLGKELSLIDPELRTDQKGRVRGYPVALIRQVASRLAKGGR